ncbi:MAG: hypothetical protein ACRCU2_10490 [Planktothrix sp.]
MNREIKTAIVGMILGILSTIATEEMRCLFLPFTSTCLRCIIKHKIFDVNPISLVLFPLIVGGLPLMMFIIFCIIDPENDINPDVPPFGRIVLATFFYLIMPLAMLVGVLYQFEKCM